jgi:hypothetical protein
MASLVEHARTELVLLGEDPMTISGYLDVVQAFADMGNSGGSAMMAIPIIEKLLCWKNLTPLTNDPDEWMDVATAAGQTSGMWQSNRNPEAFSTDGGKTYYLLSERDLDPSSLHIAQDKIYPTTDQAGSNGSY